ncbi:hypothetical protein GLOTRDRAFT_96312 [Gloeophyllum trabeum ATCC 11539]|uniref:Amino acid transporter transmembrane domain-containing protein n=1 Tax=Gloeophyllum trabeum (strain ATCC 11539 / FP-39264 / Madison 617) TaxID=670483 RepID=S7PVP9_GLOTA|nr:uncharacterized protein GLOTRDRAFT_96312 [Gloeophyllum trabeum ATCC 11539]EPQ51583.1 hypothetical protein GLOTRDRAFT_96312 [Gloeophyllum trabeum ATCC 11539]
MCLFVSLPRTLNDLGGLGAFAAATMGISALLMIVFAGVQSHPLGYTGVAPTVTTYTSGCCSPRHTRCKMVLTERTGTSSFLNISYTFIGQITLTTFIAEMRDPRDFPKGNNYVATPAVGTLQPIYKRIATSFAIPTIIYLGSLYSSVPVRRVFFRVIHSSRHKHSNTVLAWSAWVGIITATWGPGMGHRGRDTRLLGRAVSRSRRSMAGPGDVEVSASVQSIIDSYDLGTVGSPFTFPSMGMATNSATEQPAG